MTAASEEFSIDATVVVYPGTDAEQRGVILDDFGDAAGVRVEVGGDEIVPPARRWAVRLDSGELVFVDSGQLAHE